MIDYLIKLSELFMDFIWNNFPLIYLILLILIISFLIWLIIDTFNIL